MNSLMDYSKQEDRLANNKYHYYIKHYLNDRNQALNRSSDIIISQKGTKSNLNFNEKDSSRKNFGSLDRNEDNQIDFDLNSSTATFSRHQVNNPNTC